MSRRNEEEEEEDVEERRSVRVVAISTELPESSTVSLPVVNVEMVEEEETKEEIPEAEAVQVAEDLDLYAVHVFGIPITDIASDSVAKWTSRVLQLSIVLALLAIASILLQVYILSALSINYILTAAAVVAPIAGIVGLVQKIRYLIGMFCGLSLILACLNAGSALITLLTLIDADGDDDDNQSSVVQSQLDGLDMPALYVKLAIELLSVVLYGKGYLWGNDLQNDRMWDKIVMAQVESEETAPGHIVSTFNANVEAQQHHEQTNDVFIDGFNVAYQPRT